MKIYRVFFTAVCVLGLFYGNLFAGQSAGGDPVSLGLRSLNIADAPGSRQLSFGIDQSAERAITPGAYIGEAINRSLEYFFIGLCVSEDRLWVNLTPGGRDQVIDPMLEDTDLGRVLLAADLNLKKDTSEITNPRSSSVGRKYWDRLYAKAQALGIDEMPVANRVWIMPGNAVLSEHGTGARIASNDLRVCLETDLSSKRAEGLDPKQRKLQEYNIALMQEMVLPHLNKKINESPAYENLRHAYQALILARWYKNRSGSRDQGFLKRLNLSVKDEFTGRLPYNCGQIYREYMASLQKGDYNFSEDTSGKLAAYMEIITRRYFSGGIDLRKIALEADGGKSHSSMPEKYEPPGFEIVINMDTDRPVSNAIKRVRIVTEKKDELNEQAAKFDENLPPLTNHDFDKQLILKQDPAIHRVMSRNL